MTLADTARPVPVPPVRRRGRPLIAGLAIALLLVAGGATTLTYHFDRVPLPEDIVSYPVVPVAELPPAVADAFVAAVDPDFYADGEALITRRYVVLAADAGEQSGWRTWVMARKAEAAYSKTEILERYLNRAGYGRGAIGLAAAAQAYFQKSAAQLTVAEAALLAEQLKSAG